MEKVKLKVFGITFSQVQNGAYALVLSEVNGPYRIPVVVGVSEAQSIAVCLERIRPKRPLTHDLFLSCSKAFGIELEEVYIYKFEDGVFYSELKLQSPERQICIDSRTSDAIALALRSKAPIYTTREIIDATGFIFKDEKLKDKQKVDVGDDEINHKVRLDQYAISELERMMQRAVAKEEYERAAEIKNIIEIKRNNK